MMMSDQDSPTPESPLLPGLQCETTGCGCRRSSFTWVSRAASFLYFEVPKCASSTLRRALPDLERVPRETVDADFAGFYRFAIVRNPWDRMVSNYAMFIRSGRPGRTRQAAELFGPRANELTFEEFVTAASTVHNHHWEPCLSFLPTREDGSPALDFVGTLEHLDRDFATIAGALDLPSTLDTHRNKQSRGDYRDYYDAESSAVVERMLAADIEAFGYRFGG